MRITTIVLLVPALATCLAARAQKTVTLHFDGKGKLHGTLPETIFKKTDKISFQLDDLNQNFSNSLKQLTDKLKAAQKRLTKLKEGGDPGTKDDGNLRALTDMFDINGDDIDDVIKDLNAVIAKPVDDSIYHYTPIFRDSSKRYLNITT